MPSNGAAHGGAGLKGRLELWGGHECTVNRVQDVWFDQTIRAGHENRFEDLAMFADLGIRKLRYPALWERISPHSPDQRDFTWTDERLTEIRRSGMEPVVTLCHHGSGPHYTSLLDESFATGLAHHAAAVAKRYPWVSDYTPVNEPLTTARFSALYGFWYPHHREERSFWLALLNEIDATRLAMRAIRRVNPYARLVQTDDLGFCHATAPLLDEAKYQNERRWVGWDLLCGTLLPGHPLWARIVGFGLEDRLRRIADDPCPPDIIGINHYLSSERLLDHRLDLHGARGLADRETNVWNGIEYVDVDAVRSVPEQVVGLAGLVEEAWDRYGLPIAVTECHNGSTRDEQARWFIEAWDTVEALRGRGVDVRALTAWSLLGAYDWNRMVTTTAGHYEPGVFDLRSGEPRPTLMARVLKDLAEGRRPHGPGLDVPGWWREERRLVLAKDGRGFGADKAEDGTGRPAMLAILAGDPSLTETLVRACDARGLDHRVIHGDAQGRLAAMNPWAVIDARLEGLLAESWEVEARRNGVAWARIRPVGGTLDEADGLLLAETAPLFFAEGGCMLVDMLDALDRGERVVADEPGEWQGTYAPCLVDGIIDLLMDGVKGRVQFVSEPGWSKADVARALAYVAGHETCPVHDFEGRGLGATNRSSFASYLPCMDTMLERFVHERRFCRAGEVQPTSFLLEAAE